ncbi:hypothetical protein Acr_29g0009180 [Actinidia rufa]|uniref:Uncharacterized protein n=1 Tax=Actinidia rufa TaxID=165716 RepID=A0A7J0HF55_9ERIC|nr:hypothetical protein Acr_29g0009180 [Actinidia rufa]
MISRLAANCYFGCQCFCSGIFFNISSRTYAIGTSSISHWFNARYWRRSKRYAAAIIGSTTVGGVANSGEEEEIIASKVRALGKKKAAEDKLARSRKRKGKQPTEGTSYQKRGKVVGQFVWLSQALGSNDVADLATEDSKEFGGQINHDRGLDLKRANQKIHGLEKELKQTSWRSLLGRKTKLNKKWLISKKWHVVKCIGRWLISELRIPVDHPTWVALAPSIELPDPSATYPPILLPDFNEKDYVTLLAEREDINAIVVQGNKLSKVEGVVAKGADGIENEGENLFE